jgi:hypothetical protein
MKHLSLLGLLVGVAAFANPSNFDHLFSDPNCNVREAREDFPRERHVSPQAISIGGSKGFTLLGDGGEVDLPWPGIDEFWVDPSRNLVISVQYFRLANVPSSKMGVVVEFYSLCSADKLARGYRLLKSDDWKKDSLGLKLYTVGRSPRAYFNVNMRTSGLKNELILDVQVQGSPTSGSSDFIGTERFRAQRL